MIAWVQTPAPAPYLRIKKRKNGGYVHLYTGKGEGKSITAFGLALRAVGHGHKVVIVQFMKGRKDIGEYKIRKRLSPEYEIHQFGRKEFVNLENLDLIDIRLANACMHYMSVKTRDGQQPHVLSPTNTFLRRHHLLFHS